MLHLAAISTLESGNQCPINHHHQLKADKRSLFDKITLTCGCIEVERNFRAQFLLKWKTKTATLILQISCMGSWKSTSTSPNMVLDYLSNFNLCFKCSSSMFFSFTAVLRSSTFFLKFKGVAALYRAKFISHSSVDFFPLDLGP